MFRRTKLLLTSVEVQERAKCEETESAILEASWILMHSKGRKVEQTRCVKAWQTSSLFDRLRSCGSWHPRTQPLLFFITHVIDLEWVAVDVTDPAPVQIVSASVMEPCASVAYPAASANAAIPPCLLPLTPRMGLIQLLLMWNCCLWSQRHLFLGPLPLLINATFLGGH